jgi:SAM-dependent methyltransferase
MARDALPGGDLDHPLFAWLWRRCGPAAEAQGAGEHRDRLLAGLAGRVCEPGAGGGLNFPHYPVSVTEVVAVEPERRLRADTRGAASDAPVPVRVLAGRAEALPLEDGSCDAVVLSLVLCSIEDPAAALAEARRVLRPGGELRFYEHVAARGGPLAAAQRALDATVWPRLLGGCHTHRDSEAAIRAAGFRVEEVERFSFPVAWSPAAPHVLGRAVPA